MKQRIEVSAPGKLMLLGEHAVIYNYPCIVTAVNQRIRVSVQRRKEEKLTIRARSIGVENYSKKLNLLAKSRNMPKSVRFVETAVRNFFESYHLFSGLFIETKSDFSSKFGFGSSSAVTVGVIKALSELFSIRLSKKKLFDLSYKTVLDVQKVGSGFDLAAAIWGGNIYFVTGGKKIVPLKAKKMMLVVGYTGVKADTPTIVHQVASFYQRQTKVVDSVIKVINLVTEEGKRAILKGNLKKLGELMNINQGLLESLGVSSDRLAKLIFASRNAGAYGAKLSGAGIGDCMIALVGSQIRKANVENAIRRNGGTVINIEIGAEGVKIES